MPAPSVKDSTKPPLLMACGMSFPRNYPRTRPITTRPGFHGEEPPAGTF